MTNLERAKKVYEEVAEGKIMEAFEKNYAENVVMVEPNGKKEGKDACRAAEIAFLESVESFHGMEVKAMAEDAKENKVLIEVTMDVTFKETGRVLMEQVSVQTWENGLIIHERFYYNA